MKAKTAFLAGKYGAYSQYLSGYTACLSEDVEAGFYITYAKGDMPPFSTDYFKTLDEAVKSFERSYPNAVWYPIYEVQ